MTVTGLPAPGAAPAPAIGPARPGRAGLRLVLLHLASRRVPVALAALAGCAVLLPLLLDWHLLQGNAVLQAQLVLVIEAGAAAVVAVTARSPFGEPERATGRWLPYLRLATAVALTGAAVGMLAAGAASARLPGGTAGLLRDVAGLTGIALLTAVVAGGSMAWVGVLAYAGVAQYAMMHAWATPWIWPARSAHDLGAAVCAGLVFAAGLLVNSGRGARDSAQE